MADDLLTGGVSTLDEVLGGASAEIVKQTHEALIYYAGPARGPAEEAAKAAKLRGAFTVIQNWLLSHMVPDLNDAQWLFLSTGALGGTLEIERGADVTTVELMPDELYASLRAARSAKVGRPAWAASILDHEDRIHAIARGELLGLDPSGPRRRKPGKPIGSDQVKVKLRGRLEGLLANVKESLGQVDSQLQAFQPLREEGVLRGAKLNLEVLRKYAAIAGQAERNEKESKFLSDVGAKTGPLTQAFGTLAGNLKRVGEDLAARAGILESRVGDAKACLDDLEKVEAGQAGEDAAFDPETITMIRRDEDSLAAFAVKAAENAEHKVPFSGSRVLVAQHWESHPGGPDSCLATVPAVMAAFEKIGKIHVNMFPKDPEGAWVLPPVVITAVRNYVEYTDDRLIMSFVAGEPQRKGSKISLSPLEVQVLKGVGHYLCKDPLYDYRGEINAGTFIGDYSGRMEKKTQVKWAGDDKKFTMQSTSQVVDSASRSDAVNDYADVFFAFANGLQPPPKLSKRKLAVLLRYCLLESVEKTIGYLLMYVIQAELQEGKETIMKYAKNDEEAKALVVKAFADPTVAKVCGDRDFFVAKLFGKA